MIRILFVSLLLAVLSPAEVVEKAGALFDENRYRETVELINEELPALRQSGDTENLAECLSLLSIAYFRLGAFSAAWDAQNECYQLDLASGDAGNISSSLNTLAGICLAMENYAEGERLIREAIRYEEPLGNSAALAVRYGMASDILLKQGKTDEAIAFASQALTMDREAGRPFQTAIRQSQLAATYIEAGRLPEADRLLDSAATTFSEVNDLHSLTVCRHQQGMIAAKRGNFRQSAHYLREGLTLSRQTGELLQQRNISQELAVVLKDADPRAAVGYMQDAVALSDSLFHLEMSRKMAELAVENELALKEQEILSQERMLKSRSHLITLLCVLLGLMLVMAAVMLYLYLSRRRAREEASAAPLLTAREREIALLCCEGLVPKEIADRLNLSPRTVETHKNNIFRKLGVSSTAELVDLMSKLKL